MHQQEESIQLSLEPNRHKVRSYQCDFAGSVVLGDCLYKIQLWQHSFGATLKFTRLRGYHVSLIDEPEGVLYRKQNSK